MSLQSDCSRRRLLGAVGAAAAGGLAGCTDTGTPGEPNSRSPTPTPGTNCDAATVSPQGVSPEGEESGGETVTLFEDYVVVRVDVAETPAPDLVGRIETACDGPERVRRELDSEGPREFRFGPYGHHCVESYEFGLDGCE